MSAFRPTICPRTAQADCTNRAAHPCATGDAPSRSARRLPHFPRPLSFAGREPRHCPRRGKMQVFLCRARGGGEVGEVVVGCVCVVCVSLCFTPFFLFAHFPFWRGSVGE